MCILSLLNIVDIRNHFAKQTTNRNFQQRPKYQYFHRTAFCVHSRLSLFCNPFSRRISAMPRIMKTPKRQQRMKFPFQPRMHKREMIHFGFSDTRYHGVG